MNNFESGHQFNRADFTASQVEVQSHFCSIPQPTELHISRPNFLKRTFIASGGLVAAFWIAGCGGVESEGKLITTYSTTPTETTSAPTLIEVTKTPIIIAASTPEPIPTPVRKTVVTIDELNALSTWASESGILNKLDVESVLIQLSNGYKRMNSTNGAQRNAAINEFMNIAPTLIKAACANPNDTTTAKFFLALKVFEENLIDASLKEGVIIAQPAYKNLVMGNFDIPQDCPNPLLVPKIR